MGDYSKRWKKLDRLGEGGQGEVYRVEDKEKFNLKLLRHRIILGITSGGEERQQEREFDEFAKAVYDLIRMKDPKNQGALKILKPPEKARDAERASQRLRCEIKAMSGIEHPHLLEILDYDKEDYGWYVSKYQPRGSLWNSDDFKGDFVGALRAFRGLVEGVAKLHEANLVHRDIKPQNVFRSMDGRLVLGDFGLVFYLDKDQTRISGTLENVGSRDWMPPWAQGVRIEDLSSAFDVFSLGKLLWSMVNPNKKLIREYFARDKYNLEKIFKNSPYIYLSTRIFERCIVEESESCLPDANALLEIVDRYLSIIQAGGDLLVDGAPRSCRVCGQGTYVKCSSSSLSTDIEKKMGRIFSIYCCDKCGNTQFFRKNWNL